VLPGSEHRLLPGRRAHDLHLQAEHVLSTEPSRDTTRADFAQRARATALSAAVDTVAVEVVQALKSAGIRAILLKGASFARWLYAYGTPRVYVDVDLLVQEDRAREAEECLRGLGYGPLWLPEDAPADRPIASHWRRADGGAPIDLHWALPEANASPEAQWAELAAAAEPLALPGGQVETLGEVPRCVMAALHAARHAELPQPAEDLDRALRAADRQTWRAATELAWRIDAADAFSAGLRTLPAGVAVARALGIPPPVSTRGVLLQQAPPPGTMVLDALVNARSIRDQARLVLRTVFPTRQWMVTNTARAGRGGLWLVASYAWHPIGVLIRVPPAVRAWLRARRGMS
jgi:putative nucleotidyltransferase-like protein